MTSLLFRSLLLTAASSAATAGELPFAWLSGSWCADSEGARTEEHWLSPAGNRLLAVNRTLADGEVTAFEFLQLDLEGEKPVYLAQPGGRAPTAFTQTGGGDQRARFENPEHDFPTFIEYRREGSELVATIGGPTPEGEQEYAIRFVQCDG